MIKTVFIHAGVHKTGTTSIQNFLGSIRENLKSNGYLYPYFTVNNRRSFNHSYAFVSMFSKRPELYFHNKRLISVENMKIKDINDSYHKELIKQIENFDGFNLIISGEGVSLLDIDELERLRTYLLDNLNPDVKIKIIFFTRHPLSLMPSMSLEILNRGLSINESVEKVKDLSKVLFRDRIEKFQEVFGSENISVFRYEDALAHKRGLIGYFLELLNINDGHIPQIVSKRYNPSLSFEGAILLEKINKSVPALKNHEFNPARIGLKTNLLKSIPGVKYALSMNLNKQIWSHSMNDLNWLSSNFNLTPYEWYEPPQPDLKRKWSRETLMQLMRTIYQQPLKIRQVIISVLINEAANSKNHIAFIKRLNLLVTALILLFESSVLQFLMWVTGSEKRVSWVYGHIKRKLYLA